MVYIVDKSLLNKIDTLQEIMYDSDGSFYIFDTKHCFITGNKTQLNWLKMTQLSTLVGQLQQQWPVFVFLAAELDKDW